MEFSAILAIVVMLATLQVTIMAKPIMVTFGTKQGPIVPRQQPSSPTAAAAAARQIVVSPQNPAPVSEKFDDIPNPSTYRPLIPQQYRAHILPMKFLTKYTPVGPKYEIYLKQLRNLDYTGPHIFEPQEYENKLRLRPSVSYIKPIYFYQNKNKYSNDNDNDNNGINKKVVPEIGVFYSSGVRYYIPQISKYNNNNNNNNGQEEQEDEEEVENSVYDKADRKHVYRQQYQQR